MKIDTGFAALSLLVGIGSLIVGIKQCQLAKNPVVTYEKEQKLNLQSGEVASIPDNEILEPKRKGKIEKSIPVYNNPSSQPKILENKMNNIPKTQLESLNKPEDTNLENNKNCFEVINKNNLQVDYYINENLVTVIGRFRVELKWTPKMTEALMQI